MDFIDVHAWNEKVEKAFVEAKVNLPEYQKELDTILDVLTSSLNAEEREELETKKSQLHDLINDLMNDTSLGFYLLEAQEFLAANVNLLGKPVKVSFMKKEKAATSETQDLSYAFLQLVEKYNDILKLNIPKITPSKKVAVCDCGGKEFDVIDNRTFYCLRCGTQVKESLGIKSTYKDTERVNVSSKYKYTRMIHIHNGVRQLQGKQKVKIPPQCLRDVKEQLSLNGTGKNSNPQHVRNALQETGWSEQYENFVLIWSMVTENPCPDISHLEELIYHDFELVEKEYNNIMGDPSEDRSSFMSYPYVLFQLLRRRKFKCDINFFNMLKEGRIGWLDDIMEKIYQNLEWTGFQPLG